MADYVNLYGELPCGCPEGDGCPECAEWAHDVDADFTFWSEHETKVGLEWAS